jgi:hypothetical protein
MLTAGEKLVACRMWSSLVASRRFCNSKTWDVDRILQAGAKMHTLENAKCQRMLTRKKVNIRKIDSRDTGKLSKKFPFQKLGAISMTSRTCPLSMM